MKFQVTGNKDGTNNMNLRKNKLLTIFICSVTAIALVLGFALTNRANQLKADENEPEAPVVTEESDYTAPEVSNEAPAEEQPVSDASETEPAEEAAEASADENKGTEVTQEIIIELPAVEPAVDEEPEKAVENEYPADTEAEETEDPEENVTEEETEIDISRLKVEIRSDRKPVMEPGDEVHLEGILTGFEDIEYSLRWQCDKNDGEGFRDIPGADGLTYSFSASAESLSWRWRLVVDF